MEDMSAHMEAAYKLLYRWVKNECRALDSDSPDVPVLLLEAFGALQERPVLLRLEHKKTNSSPVTAYKKLVIQGIRP